MSDYARVLFRFVSVVGVISVVEFLTGIPRPGPAGLGVSTAI